VSNSLPCLLNAVNASLPASHPSYNREISSIAEGLGRYRRQLVTSAGVVQLTYFDNLTWNAGEHLKNTILLTGYHGDKVWDLHHVAPGGDIVRGDASGLGLTEYRLWARFLHCPVPFWGVRRAAEIGAVSRSSELRAFVLPGTDYNRPIPRRIAEEAGVPRFSFGITKNAAEPFLWRGPRWTLENRPSIDT